ncbi:hypothetical protein [Pseudobdellovibrio sp. HCB154]|uniref:hypothetical protein n=1 Tax=Pseudobdellovibrio sp. HCB154 TaxID=3386277 RepID=UPI0039173205
MKKFLVLILLAFTVTAQAQMACVSLFETPYETLNARLTKRYPRLEFMTKDPRGFIKEIQERYKEQRLKDPAHALEFDYSDVAMPMVEYSAKHLETKISETTILISETKMMLEEVSSLRILKKRILEKQVKEYEAAEQFYKALANEARFYLAQNKVSYQKSIEFLYYFSRAYGHFETRKLPFMTRFYLGIDRAFQGYKQLPIEKEFARYQERKFEIFQRKSAVNGFVISEKSYLEALQHPEVKAPTEELKAIIVPLYDAIGREFLMRYMPTEISVVGVTHESIEADGFKRPSGDFWMHDIRHESARQQEIKSFMEKNDMTLEQWHKFSSLQEKWYLEYKKHLGLIQDKELKEAIELSTFNYFHDRGYPFVPSVWKNRKSMHVYYGLVLMLTLSGQGTGFKNVRLNTKIASDWLDKFFEARLAEEAEGLSQILNDK